MDEVKDAMGNMKDKASDAMDNMGEKMSTSGKGLHEKSTAAAEARSCALPAAKRRSAPVFTHRSPALGRVLSVLSGACCW